MLTSPPVHPHNSSGTPMQGSSSCQHSIDFFLFTQDDNKLAFCGLCRLRELWEDEVPRKIHAYKVLADNGNPQVAGAFYAHLQASVGLIAPKPDENLNNFRLARGRLYRAPSEMQFPLLRALWEMMGTQPKLASALICQLNHQDSLVSAANLKMTSYGFNQATAKAIRLALRTIRSF